MSNSNHEPIVLYLSRRRDKNGRQLFANFAASYLKHPAGWSHTLVLVKKGFQGHEEEWQEWTQALGEVSFCEREVSDDTYTFCDEAIREFANHYILFLTSHSEIIADNWLDLYMRHANENRILGACGGGMTNYRRWGKQNFWNKRHSPLRHPVQWGLATLMRISQKVVHKERVTSVENPYLPFPFVGLRTNSVLLPPRILEKIEWPNASELGVKMGPYIFETGKYGLFGQAVSKDIELFVVGADGLATPATEGYLAETYGCGEQKNLIIADNVTILYTHASRRKKKRIDNRNWGDHTPMKLIKLSMPISDPQNDFPCPVCGHKRTFPHINAKDYNRQVTEELFHYSKCEACFSIFLTNPPLNIGEYYAGDYGPYRANVNLQFVDWQVSFVKKHVKAGATCCEIGPGSGDLICAMKQSGYSVQAIEMDAATCEFIQSKGISVVQSDDPVSALRQLNESQDCILAWHVLEHLPNPIQVLKAASEKLKPNGILIIAMPNPASPEAEMFREYWYGIDAPRHQTLVRCSTLVEIAKNLGLDEVEVSWNDVVAQAIDASVWLFSMKNWRAALGQKPVLYKYLCYGIMKHCGKHILKLFRRMSNKQHYSNSYAVVFRKSGDF